MRLLADRATEGSGGMLCMRESSQPRNSGNRMAVPRLAHLLFFPPKEKDFKDVHQSTWPMSGTLASLSMGRNQRIQEEDKHHSPAPLLKRRRISGLLLETKKGTGLTNLYPLRVPACDERVMPKHGHQTVFVLCVPLCWPFLELDSKLKIRDLK